MNNDQPQSQSDVWANWLLHERFADDPSHERTLRAEIAQYADRVLDAAQLAPGMTLVDVGTGDGLVAFRAIDRVGPSLRVLLTDVATSLLQHAGSIAIQRGPGSMHLSPVFSRSAQRHPRPVDRCRHDPCGTERPYHLLRVNR